MSGAIFYLFKALLDVFTLGVILNFLFRLLRVDYFNPIVRAIIRAVDYPSQLIRYLIKPIYRIDFAALIVAILIQSAAFYLVVVAGSLNYDPSIITIWSLYSVLILCLKVLFWVMLAGIIISWVANDHKHPAIRLILQMSDSIFKPFRFFLPPTGGLDFSPILAFFALRALDDLFTYLAQGSGLSTELVEGWAIPFWFIIGF